MTNEEDKRASGARLALDAARQDGRGFGSAHFEDDFKAFIRRDGFTLEIAYETLAAPLDETQKKRLNAFLARKTLALWEKEARRTMEMDAASAVPDESVEAQLNALFGAPDESLAALFGDFMEKTPIEKRTPPPGDKLKILSLDEDEIDAVVEAVFNATPPLSAFCGAPDPLFPLDAPRTSFARTVKRVCRRVFAFFENEMASRRIARR
jgi:hypothetical protein